MIQWIAALSHGRRLSFMPVGGILEERAVWLLFSKERERVKRGHSIWRGSIGR
jgi:hypothetical protein